MERLRLQQKFPILLTLLFALICGLGMARHEMWRDELQIWMLVRDSGSLLDLFQNLRYETGHPFLWYLCLYGVSRLTRQPIAMQGVHLAIATAAVYLLARYSPFTRWQQGLFAFGYFSLFEFGIISRNYGLGMLLLFGVCVLFPQRHQRYWPIALLLFLACNTNFYAMLCAVAIAAMLILERVLPSYQGWKAPLRQWDAGLSLGIVALGLVLCGLQLITPADAGIETSGVKPLSLNRVVSAIALIWKSYAPLPVPSLHFWNKNLVREGDAAFLSVLLVIGAIAVFIRKPLILFLYSSGTGAIVLMSLLKHGGGLRHWGFAFVLFVVCLWLATDLPDAAYRPPRFWLRLHHWLTQKQNSFFTVILSLQLLAGGFAYGMDWVFPFSQAQATSQFIQQQPMTELALIGDRDWAALTVSGFLDQPLFYPASDREGTFLIWNDQRRDRALPEVIERSQQHLITQQQTGLLILNNALTAPELALFPQTPQIIGQFTGAIVSDENYHLYKIRP
jgi:hypothetical protein